MPPGSPVSPGPRRALCSQKRTGGARASMSPRDQMSPQASNSVLKDHTRVTMSTSLPAPTPGSLPVAPEVLAMGPSSSLHRTSQWPPGPALFSTEWATVRHRAQTAPVIPELAGTALHWEGSRGWVRPRVCGAHFTTVKITMYTRNISSDNKTGSHAGTAGSLSFDGFKTSDKSLPQWHVPTFLSTPPPPSLPAELGSPRTPCSISIVCTGDCEHPSPSLVG